MFIEKLIPALGVSMLFLAIIGDKALFKYTKIAKELGFAGNADGAIGFVLWVVLILISYALVNAFNNALDA